MNFRLGRLRHDPVAVAAAPKHSHFGFVAPVSSLDRSAIDYEPDLGYNNILPICTTVGLWNAAKGIALLNRFTPTVQMPLLPPFYAETIGLAATASFAELAATDGAVMLDVLNYQAAHGFNIGNQSLVCDYGTLAFDINTLASAMVRQGPSYLGIQLYQRDMDAVETDGSWQTWDTVPGQDDGQFVGDHCVVDWDFVSLDPDGIVRLATWGKLQKATWRWLMTRLEEAYGLIFRELVASDGSYLGTTVDDLMASLGS